MDKMDYKKAYKELYQPKTVPGVVDVPEMTFIQVDGQGDPNEPGGRIPAGCRNSLCAVLYDQNGSQKRTCSRRLLRVRRASAGGPVVAGGYSRSGLHPKGQVLLDRDDPSA
ncbi:hypothetical protein SAMN05216192_1208 [Paenibacillus typhae]|uniref:Uncharacterized protein n=1 Tax=Paenibacillus typhae TaxID=1174501 RepID=A0A1G8V1J5_9BACL|nr:hypothetical protein SAMN05216192_1208 [Paenibacillus typhae]